MADFTFPVRVYYEDTDAAGLVYHTNYLKYMERARSEYLREQGYTHQQLAEEDNLVFVVSNLNIQYKSPARFDDLLQVLTSVSGINAASFSFVQQINRDEVELCHAEVEIVCLNRDSGLPKRIPEQLKSKFNNDN